MGVESSEALAGLARDTLVYHSNIFWHTVGESAAHNLPRLHSGPYRRIGSYLLLERRNAALVMEETRMKTVPNQSSHPSLAFGRRR
jgi:hypothetical protein